MSLVAIKSNPVRNSFCPISDADWAYLVGLLWGEAQSTPFNFGSATPPPDGRTVPWIRTNQDGTPDRTYVFSGGLWLCPHYEDPGIVKMFTGTLAQIPLLEGGNNNPVTAFDGPFWQKLASVDAKMPIQPGTLPSTAVIAAGDTGGEEKHTLLPTEMPAHAHQEFAEEVAQGLAYTGPWKAIDANNPQVANENNYDNAGTGASYYVSGSNKAATLGRSSVAGGDGSGNTVAHNNLPPYFGIWFIQRTNRLYYSIPG